MDKTPIVLLQQRDFGQKMNVSFEFVTQNFGPLLKALAIIAGPPALLCGIAQGMFQSRLLSGRPGGDVLNQFASYLSLEYLFVIVFSLITYFLAYAAVSAFLVLYEENKSSENLTTENVWKKLTENISGSIVAQIISVLLVLAGTVFFLIPGIYLAICFQFFMIIAIREKLSATDILKRSYKLIQGKWWSTFGLIVIMSIVSGIVSLFFQLPTLAVTIMSTLGFSAVGTNLKTLTIIASAISMVGSTVVQGIVWVAVAFQYYNLVERLEGSSLRAEIESLGKGGLERPNEEDRF